MPTRRIFTFSFLRFLMHFFKYQGTGNDFVMIDDRAGTFPADDYALVHRLCERRFGIGADGLILLRLHADYDFEMVYYNADGRPGSMCGNGGRCTVAFARQLGVIQDRAHFLAADGPHHASIDPDGTVRLRMIDVAGEEELTDGVYLHTGSPHIVRFVPGGALAGHDVVGEGRAVRYGAYFGERGGTNVNFVEEPAAGGQPWQVRTYERGVEDETHSCGTGVTAVALAAARRGAASPVPLRTVGGELSVSFTAQADGAFTDVYLNGPATFVFEGDIQL